LRTIIDAFARRVEYAAAVSTASSLDGSLDVSKKRSMLKLAIEYSCDERRGTGCAAMPGETIVSADASGRIVHVRNA
jgi:hypothetical protein